MTLMQFSIHSITSSLCSILVRSHDTYSCVSSTYICIGIPGSFVLHCLLIRALGQLLFLLSRNQFGFPYKIYLTSSPFIVLGKPVNTALIELLHFINISVSIESSTHGLLKSLATTFQICSSAIVWNCSKNKYVILSV